MSNKSRVFYSALSILIFLASWEILAFFFKDVPFLFPSPKFVSARLLSSFSRFVFHSFQTLKEMFFGMLIAIMVSFPLSYLMSRFEAFRALLQPYFIVVQCVPMFTLAPIFIICFGWTMISVVIPTAMMIMFPLTMSIYKGLVSTPKEYVNFFRIHGSSEATIYFRLRLPFATPHIFSGLRISSAIAGVGAIAGEWAGAQKGLGVFIQICRRNFDLLGVFVAIFCLLALSLSFYGLIILLEKIFSRGSYEIKNFKKPA